MTKFLRVLPGIILLALVLTIQIAGATGQDALKADLNVSKAVSSTGPYQINDEITWAITLRNDGPANATNITLQEDISQLAGLKNITAVTDIGLYNTTTNTWCIGELKNASSARLTLSTVFSTSGIKTNSIRITGLDETDPVAGNNFADAVVHINTSADSGKDEPVSVNLVFRPTTLNLYSKGVFGVYVTLAGGMTSANEKSKNSRIDYANSSLTCSGADLVKATTSSREGRTLIAKFHRADLENVTTGSGVLINCSGTLSVNGTMIPVEGSDMIRVTGEKKGVDAYLSRLLKFLGLEKDDVKIIEGEDGNITVTLSLNPDNFKNFGQVKKMPAPKDNVSDRAAGNETAGSYQNCSGKENYPKNTGDDKKFTEKNADNKPGKGNKGSDKHDNESSGKSDGKKNT
jgi:uncharacterized repeat protein (TIGR01451 family)